ncbi:MAG: hypothetical protein AMJ81_04760 [Phycisphaerae bacterium SM23_33]|nr:MAG: hypothetical protein AMJ81_04760 [Phycisphaerae bacterium SM23_33]
MPAGSRSSRTQPGTGYIHRTIRFCRSASIPLMDPHGTPAGVRPSRAEEAMVTIFLSQAEG